MSATVEVTISNSDAVVLIPSITDALQAALVYLNENQASVSQVQSYITQILEYVSQAQAAADTAQGLVTNARAFLLTNLTAIVAALPTTLPSTPGQLWLNGGVLELS